MYCFWFLIGLIYQMSYSLDYLVFQMCPHFDFTVKWTNISNQQHDWSHKTFSASRCLRHSLQHLWIPLPWLSKQPFSPPCSDILPVHHVRRLKRQWPWCGWARCARDSVSSTPCWCVFLIMIFNHEVNTSSIFSASPQKPSGYLVTQS